MSGSQGNLGCRGLRVSWGRGVSGYEDLLRSWGILCVHSYVYVTTTITLTYVYALSGSQGILGSRGLRVSGSQGNLGSQGNFGSQVVGVSGSHGLMF